LESGGARVVPVDFELNDEQLSDLLGSLNGLYIPGDSKSLVQKGNYKFTEMVRRILKWSQKHNEKEAQHFPILGVGYGSLAMLKSQMTDHKDFTSF
jgi:hypothetical protein